MASPNRRRPRLTMGKVYRVTGLTRAQIRKEAQARYTSCDLCKRGDQAARALQIVPGCPRGISARTTARPLEYILKPLRAIAAPSAALIRAVAALHHAVESSSVRSMRACALARHCSSFLLRKAHTPHSHIGCAAFGTRIIERYPSVAAGPCPDTAILSSRWEHVPEVG